MRALVLILRLDLVGRPDPPTCPAWLGCFYDAGSFSILLSSEPDLAVVLLEFHSL